MDYKLLAQEPEFDTPSESSAEIT
jgi:hypothetical protein